MLGSFYGDGVSMPLLERTRLPIDLRAKSLDRHWLTSTGQHIVDVVKL